MTFLIILAGYVVGTLITARIIGNEIHKDGDDEYGMTALAFVWPVLALIFGWLWWVEGAERKEARLARKERVKAEKVEAARVAEKKRLDALCEPWRMALRDPNASEQEKAFAEEMLRGLVLDTSK